MGGRAKSEGVCGERAASGQLASSNQVVVFSDATRAPCEAVTPDFPDLPLPSPWGPGFLFKCQLLWRPSPHLSSTPSWPDPCSFGSSSAPLEAARPCSAAPRRLCSERGGSATCDFAAANSKFAAANSQVASLRRSVEAREVSRLRDEARTEREACKVAEANVRLLETLLEELRLKRSRKRRNGSVLRLEWRIGATWRNVP